MVVSDNEAFQKGHHLIFLSHLTQGLAGALLNRRLAVFTQKLKEKNINELLNRISPKSVRWGPYYKTIQARNCILVFNKLDS